MPSTIRVALIGDFDPSVTAHQAIPRALDLAAAVSGTRVDGCWLATDRIDDAPDTLLQSFDAFWCVPASPYRSTSGALRAITHARTSDVPFLGTCGGFQHAILEYARNVLGVTDAAHAELQPNAANLFLAPLSCSLIEVEGRITLREGSKLRACYDRSEIEEGYHCSFGLNEDYREALAARGMKFTVFADDGTVRGFELDDHRYFVGVLFQPERAALRGIVTPPAVALLNAAMQKKNMDK